MTPATEKRHDEVFPDSPHQPLLWQAINAATKDLHDVVNVLIVQRFMLGLRDYRLYREGIRSFYHVYSAFERTWDSLLSSPDTMPPHVYAALQAIADPRLRRASAIAQDLEYLYGPSFDRSAPPQTKALLAAVAHIESALKQKPHLVLAYAHSYYMALFAGGKMLCRQILAAKDFFPVNPPAGSYDEAKIFATNMFVFPVEQGKEEALRRKFKDAMEAVEGGLSEEEKTDIIEESRTIFKTNERLVLDLDKICATLSIPTPKLEVEEKTIAGFVEQYGIAPLAITLALVFWAIKLWFFS